MTRVDLRADSTGMYYLEVNVNPGKNKFSYLTIVANSLGLDYRAIIAFIPYQAMLRYELEPPRKLKELARPVMALFDALAYQTQDPAYRTQDPAYQTQGKSAKT